MRILHSSDWHIGRALFDYSLLEDQRYFFEQLYRTVKEQKVDVVVVSGDLYDRSAPSAEAVALLDEVFHHLIFDCKVPVLAIAGNHDSPRRIDYGNSLFEACGLYLAGSVQKEIKKVTLQDSYGPVNFFLLPYFVPHEIRLQLEQPELSGFSQAFQALMEENRSRFDPSQRNVLLAHGFFMTNRGEASFSTSEHAVGPSELCDLSPAAEFDYIALGHLHHGQSAGLKQARYSGSPLKYSVSEATQRKEFLLVDLNEKGSVEITSLPIQPLRDLCIIKGTVEELLEQPRHSEDYVFAQLEDDSPVLHAMNRLRAVYPHILGLSFRQSGKQGEIQRYDAKEEPMEELFLRFYQEIYGEDAPEVRRELLHGIIDHMEVDA
ncbi:MAG: exonuclease SbcCD subunit D [Oscillospiraceae bacterium]|nr:exonuclease SbcCD subunit D [Oscillospiraceae bacterium]